MDIKWLEDFLCLCEQMNFSRAAEKRHITQSAFSRRIKSLESWLGATLINRDAYPPHLTPEGEQFRQTATETLRSLNQLRTQYRHGTQHSKHSIRIATQQTISTTFFPSWLTHVEQHWGPINVQLNADRITDCVDTFICGDVDFMFLYSHESIPFSLNKELFPCVVVGQETLIPVSCPGANRQPLYSLPGQEQQPVPYLSYTPDSCFGQALNKLHQQHEQSCHFQTRYENSFSHSLRVLALKGHGLTWLPECGIRHELEAGRLCRAGDKSWDLYFDIRLYYAQERLDPITRSLVEFSRQNRLV